MFWVQRAALVIALVLIAAAPAQAAFPGANGRISYQDQNGIHVINPDGTGEETLTRSGGSFSPFEIRGPVWSPDGRQLAAARVFGGFGEAGWIFLVNSDGTGQRFLTPQVNTLDEKAPTWSPDGRTVAFEEHNFTTFFDDLASRDTTTGTTFRTLAASQQFGVEDPSWSPDGAHFVFERQQGVADNCEDLWSSDARGRNQVKLTNTAADELDGDWSPDSRQIVFSTSRGEPSCFGTHHIAVMNANGSGIHVLTSTLPGDGNQVQTAPRFSPDGRQIVYERRRAGGAEIWIINADGTGDHKLADGVAPSWQPIPAGAATPPSPGAPVLVSASAVSPLGGGTDGTGTVTLDRVAPTGGTVVHLSSSNIATATVPATFTVPGGSDHGDFTITGGHPAADTPVTITATLGSVSKTATLTVQGTAGLSSVSLPASVGGGLSAQGFALLTTGSGLGSTVALTSSNPAVATVPATATINGTQASFVVHTNTVTTTTPVTITATFAGTSASATLNVAAGDPLASLTLADGAALGVCAGGAVDSEKATVNLSSVSAEPVTVSLSSSDPAVQVPASVQVGDPASTSFFASVISSVSATRTVTLTATALGVTKTAQLTVSPCGAGGGPPPPPPPTADTVRVTRAQYDTAKRELRVEATSTNAGATLRALNDSTGAVIGTLQGNGGTYKGQFTNVANPGTVRVTSSLGGSATLAVTGATGTVRPPTAIAVGAPSASAKSTPASRPAAVLLHATTEVDLGQADPQDHAAPTVGLLRALPRSIRVGSRRGTLVSFTLSEASRVTLSFQRLHETHFARVAGRIERTLPKGRVRVRFNGLLAGGAALRPGVYRVIVDAVDASGNHAAPKRLLVYLHRAIR